MGGRFSGSSLSEIKRAETLKIMVQTLQSGVAVSILISHCICSIHVGFFPSGLATQAGIPKPKIVKEVNKDADLESNFMQADSLTWLP